LIIDPDADYYSWEGYFHQHYGTPVKPYGQFRSLSLFINIIYDQTPARDPYPNSNGIWDPAVHEGINNESTPIYLLDFLDTDYDPLNINGTMTRLYHESSFGSFIFLGDFVVININQSTITPPPNSGDNFTATDLTNAAILLINNAGIISDSLFIKMDYDKWNDVINTNLYGTFILIKKCLPKMILTKWGRIVNISSVLAYTGNAGQSNYVASKAGIIGMSKSIAQEVASKGITVNNIAPGFIYTDMTKDITYKQKNKIISKIPISITLDSLLEFALISSQLLCLGPPFGNTDS